MHTLKHLYGAVAVVLELLLAVAACGPSRSGGSGGELILSDGRYPYVTLHDGHYYYTMQSPGADSITLWQTDDLHQLSQATRRTVFTASPGMQHFWSPELHYMDGAWYLYFEADDGNTDNHQLYVMQCTSTDPMTGTFTMKGTLHTNSEWNFGLHPTVMDVGGSWYLLWSGWPKRRAETEVQCIYIARLDNPWTVGSQRVMISQPEYEWERQWINPDGSRSAYPIYVNENPQAFLSPDGSRVFVCYSASGIWTVYHTMGLLTAPTSANLLDPQSWTKLNEPQFRGDSLLTMSASNVSIVPSQDGRQQLLVYGVKWHDADGEHRNVCMHPIGWTADQMPVFGKPVME